MEETLQCFYCEKGTVLSTALPTACPECKAPLQKRMDLLTPEELKMATARKMLGGYSLPVYTLAS